VVKEEVAILVVLVGRCCRAVGAAVRRAVVDEAPGTIEDAHAFLMRCLYMPLVRLASLFALDLIYLRRPCLRSTYDQRTHLRPAQPFPTPGGP